PWPAALRTLRTLRLPRRSAIAAARLTTATATTAAHAGRSPRRPSSDRPGAEGQAHIPARLRPPRPARPAHRQPRRRPVGVHRLPDRLDPRGLRHPRQPRRGSTGRRDMTERTAAEIKRLIGGKDADFALLEYGGTMWATNRYWAVPAVRIT